MADNDSTPVDNETFDIEELDDKQLDGVAGGAVNNSGCTNYGGCEGSTNGSGCTEKPAQVEISPEL